MGSLYAVSEVLVDACCLLDFLQRLRFARRIRSIYLSRRCGGGCGDYMGRCMTSKPTWVAGPLVQEQPALEPEHLPLPTDFDLLEVL